MNTEQVNELIQSLESAGELSIKETKVMALAKAYQQLAAENVALKAAIDATIGWQQSTDVENVESVRMLLDINTPATDRIVAGIKADGAEACVRALVTSDDNDFTDAPNICAEVARLLREGAK
ncbi:MULTISPECIES: hypothetical protein [Klebsiella]|uniref:hypothetical protein n=1 Tax=Klebsiella TaxID=570 RepID=UPI000BFBE4F4|nr:hypothetical protein [Klebsiella oxytoca]HED3230639.1 hypothetical protein [Klebsiella oxytoca]HED3471810.1 hypothetical protein [Klebsiella oxytoca]